LENAVVVGIVVTQPPALPLYKISKKVESGISERDRGSTDLALGRVQGCMTSVCEGMLVRSMRGKARLAALDIAAALQRIDIMTRERESRGPRMTSVRHMAVRPLLDALYTPEPALRRPADDVVVCRCEEVSAGEIRRIAVLGCTGPNQMKAFSRCGMGPCQGRWCGATVGELIAEVQCGQPGDVGHYRIRAPVKPVTIEEIANAMPANSAVVRGEFPS
jgi:hypothetical protein